MRKLIKNTIKKGLWPLLPKPWETPDMEFHYGLWNGVSALYCDSGRQLGEENARPLALNHHIPAETLACKYPGSRNGRLINISALRTAMQNFDPALAITQAVRQRYLSLLPPQHQLGLWDLNIIARASIALIAYQRRFKRQMPAGNSVSDALTSQYQFISGVFMICRHMMDAGDPLIAKNAVLDAQALYDYADEHGIFISFNAMACAGSLQKILQFLHFCNEGGEDAADLAAIVTEPDNWLRYALAAIELDCVIEEQRALTAASAHDDPSAGPASSARIYRDFGDYLRGLMQSPPAPLEKTADFEQAALARQNRILEILELETIAKLRSKHIAARLG